ncbi:uncharacterized protein F4812DRAFT_422621 [Daldinia caldariorum]|uniref:uncharacterized protein n=1 Tax=Daldinia caldariorum TaxID=326644 RepID=UPI0020084F78|nr:uncharacterized protein F4812DRAFT_422621 [Daldinia caldariorum]KAI1469288.1 hypothetical protein F4812DRAFT_422621 [Daldinia caldariorum]
MDSVIKQFENRIFQSDNLFPSWLDSDPPSLSTETQESAPNMSPEEPPIDIFSGHLEPFGNLSHEDVAGRLFTGSTSKKPNLLNPTNLNPAFSVLPPFDAVDPYTELSGPSSNKEDTFLKLNSTSADEQIAFTSTTQGDLSPGWNPGMDSTGINDSDNKLENVTRQKNSEIETSQEALGDRLNHSLSSPLPSACSSHPSNLGNSSNVTEYDSMNSSDFEDELNWVDHGVLQPLISPILDELLQKYFKTLSLSRYPLNTTPSGSTPSRHQNPATTQQHGESASKDAIPLPRGKRGYKDSNQHQSGDEYEDEDKNPRKRTRYLDPPIEVQPTFWACPFSKWKPLSYRKCCQYILKDISRVKQHLRRYHERPPYCPVCWKVFPEEDGFESHIQSRTCSPRPKADLEGVTSVQQKQLERRSDKQLTKRKQWYAIYDILFPGQPHPDSPYLESDLSSELLSFEKFMATEGLQIVERAAREHIPHDLMPLQDEVLAFSQTLYQQAIPQILRRYDATRPVHNSPDILKGSGLPSVSGNDCDSGRGTLSHISHDRDSGDPEQDRQEAQDLAMADRIDCTGFNLAPGDDAQIQALWITDQAMGDAVQPHDIHTVDTSVPTGPQHLTPYAPLDSPSGFTFDNFDEQLFASGGAATGLGGGQNGIWDADFSATLGNDGLLASTGQF